VRPDFLIHRQRYLLGPQGSGKKTVIVGTFGLVDVFEDDGFEGCTGIVRGNGVGDGVQADPLIGEKSSSRVGGDTQVGALGRRKRRDRCMLRWLVSVANMTLCTFIL